MVTNKRKDTSIKLSKWIDEEIEEYLSDKRIKLRFPSKRNFIDQAAINFLEKEKLKKTR